MSISAAFMFFGLLPALIFVLAWLFNRRHWKRVEATLDRCECTIIGKRAEKMHAAVDAKIRAMDSRSGGDSVYVVKPPADSTEITPALPDNKTALVIAFVLVLLLG